MEEQLSTPTPALSTAETVEQIAASETGLTSDQISTMVEWARADLKAGKITQAQFDQQADELNLSPADRAPDTRSDEVKDLDTHFPPATPEQFTIHYGQDMTPELRAFDSNARTWLAGAGFPQNLGTSLVHAIEAVTKQTQHMDETQLAEYGNKEYLKLQSIYGTELDAKLRETGYMINIIEQQRPGLKALLRSRGIGDSARTVTLLIDQSRRFWARRRSAGA